MTNSVRTFTIPKTIVQWAFHLSSGKSEKEAEALQCRHLLALFAEKSKTFEKGHLKYGSGGSEFHETWRISFCFSDVSSGQLIRFISDEIISWADLKLKQILMYLQLMRKGTRGVFSMFAHRCSSWLNDNDFRLSALYFTTACCLSYFPHWVYSNISGSDKWLNYPSYLIVSSKMRTMGNKCEQFALRNVFLDCSTIKMSHRGHKFSELQ